MQAGPSLLRGARRRTADSTQALRAKRLCCVLGARAIGKSSLLLRAARVATRGRHAGRRRRSASALPSSSATNDTEDGWLRRIAERVAAELELGVDVGAWWSATRCRRRESARRVFLGSRPDQHDRADRRARRRGRRRARAAVRGRIFSTRSRRVTNAAAASPTSRGLAFVLAGCTSQRALAAESPDSAFADAEIIEPEDFDAEQAYRLAVAFGGERSSRRR